VEEQGGLAPDFTLSSLDGRQVSLHSFRGQTVLIDFWATWCAPCVYQIPVLNRFQDRHRDDGVVVLGVSVDVAGRDVVAAFAREHDIRYPVLLGSEAVARRYGAPGFPSLVVIGPRGRIESVHVGVLEAETLETLVGEVASSRLVAPGKNPA
jgi:peroxiredoxin